MGTAVASAGLAGLTRAAEGGYHGPPELTVARAFTEWTLDPWMLALVLVLGGGYLAGARRQPGWPVGRRIWFLGLGLGSVVIATMSCIGAYQHVLFFARAIQTVLLVLVAPLFLALGRPISLFIAVFPPNQFTAVYLPDTAYGCGKPVQTLFIAPVRSGASSQ